MSLRLQSQAVVCPYSPSCLDEVSSETRIQTVAHLRIRIG
jgi:hypothetical protein